MDQGRPYYPKAFVSSRGREVDTAEFEAVRTDFLAMLRLTSIRIINPRAYLFFSLTPYLVETSYNQHPLTGAHEFVKPAFTHEIENAISPFAARPPKAVIKQAINNVNDMVRSYCFACYLINKLVDREH